MGAWMAGEASDWDFDQVLQEAVIGGIAGGFGAAAGSGFANSSIAANLGAGGAYANAAVGGADASALSTVMYDPSTNLFDLIRCCGPGRAYGLVGYAIGTSGVPPS